jgi:predicted peptidase
VSERFAALVPICGGVRGAASKGGPFAAFPDSERPKEIARRLAGKPIWIFHGADDWMVPVRNSREMATVLRAAGNEVRFTEYAGVGHNAWDRAYADPALWAWLLAQRRP